MQPPQARNFGTYTKLNKFTPGYQAVHPLRVDELVSVLTGIYHLLSEYMDGGMLPGCIHGMPFARVP